MSARVLDGRQLSQEIRSQLSERVATLRERGVVPRLDVIVASQDPASVAYVTMKRRWAEKAGIQGESYEVNSATTQPELMAKISELNANPDVHGVLIQHPLPSHLDEPAALLALGPQKDVDGITPQSLGNLLADVPGFRCATPLGIIRLLKHYGIPIAGKRAVDRKSVV